MACVLRYPTVAPAGRQHPTEKPVEIFPHLVASSMPTPCSTVHGLRFDAPRCHLGRKAIGIEIEERYCDRRSPLRQEVLAPVTVRPPTRPSSRPTAGADRPTSAEDILDLLDALRPAWHADAACRGQTRVMFPVAEHGHRLDTTAARALCDRCPRPTPCAEQGRTERYGVWGAGPAADGSASGTLRRHPRRPRGWRLALDRRHRPTGQRASLHRPPLSRRARLRRRPRTAEATPIRLLPTEGDDVNELEALTAAEPKRGPLRPSDGHPHATAGSRSPSPGRRRSPTPSTTATT